MSTEKMMTIQERIYQDILNQIIVGDFDVNDVLNEGEIAARYNVSRSPVREALLRLCYAGLIRNVPRYGYVLVALDMKEVLEITEVRSILELAALNLTEKLMPIPEEKLDILRNIYMEGTNKRIDDDITARWNINRRFHHQLSLLSQNEFLSDLIDEVLIKNQQGSMQYYRASLLYISQEEIHRQGEKHLQIIDAIAHNDFECAKVALSEDIKLIAGSIPS